MLLSYVGSLGCFTTAYIALAVAILYDRNEIFPKWFAYVTVWQIVTEVMAVPVFVFNAGPFAWNGSIAFWVGTVIFGVWVCVSDRATEEGQRACSRRRGADCHDRYGADRDSSRRRGAATRAAVATCPATAPCG